MDYQFERTSLWKAAFNEDPRTDEFQKERHFFKQNFLKFRSKVELLVSNISKDIPSLTVHDITHLDALWETASLVAGPGITLNPAEAYVLGGAILLHDAGMSIASYPGGLDSLKKTTEWKDVSAAIAAQKKREGVPAFNSIDSADLPRIISEVLRIRHSQHAEELAQAAWPGPDGGAEFLIDDVDLRTFYGPTIGKIARSHWLAVSDLEAALPQSIGASTNAPASWGIDPIKLACLLRLADATHIDERRAPRFLRTLLKPSGVSDQHWNFQSKMAKVTIENDALVYTSGPEFSIEDADAWWICFDTVSMIDRELNSVDVLLENTKRTSFAAKRVKAVDTPSSFSRFVRTREWTPIDAHPMVSNIPNLVRMLGGKHLYGDDLAVPVRELIQNAADAIRARRAFHELDNAFGEIVVKLENVDGHWWLSVADDGIGMSRRVLTGTLLDFGASFWSSAAVREEFPGLLASGLAVTGKYGVGFFSVFMLGDTVRVRSRRCDAASEATLILEFRNGLELRPILRPAKGKEMLPQGGTTVSVRLATDPFAPKGLLSKTSWNGKSSTTTLDRFVGAICPNIDVKVTASLEAATTVVVAANDWLPLNSKLLLDRLQMMSPLMERNTSGIELTTIEADDGQIFGRAAVLPYIYPGVGVVTVGGLVAASVDGIAGVLLGVVTNVSRNSARPTVPANVLAKWASTQASKIASSTWRSADKLSAAKRILLCGGAIGDLPIAVRDGEYFSYWEIVELARSSFKIDFYVGSEIEYDEDSDSCHPREFERYFTVDERLFFIDKPTHGELLKFDNQSWPKCLFEETKTLQDLFLEAVEKAWGENYDYWEDEDGIVGEVDGEEIRRKVNSLQRND